jgi:hypothetical protein
MILIFEIILKYIMVYNIENLRPGKTLRISSWERTGGNDDNIKIKPHSTYVMADIKGPGKLTHFWLSGIIGYRELLLKITWDDSNSPSIFVPIGDFCGAGNSRVNSYQCAYFSCSVNENQNNKKNGPSALNCYLPMPFKKSAKIEVINDSNNQYMFYFYIDYEIYENEIPLGPDPGYLHAEFRQETPFGGWAPELFPNTPETDGIMNLEEDAWNNNYTILETKGRGHYLGCFFNVINTRSPTFDGYRNGYSWWGEGDDMIWIDGYKWPPDLHGTGSEDYFNHAWGMQRNDFMRNGVSIHEFDTDGYITCYIFHIDNLIRFQKEIKVTIEIGHGNHFGNDISSIAFFYLDKPNKVLEPPALIHRIPIEKENGKWVRPEGAEYTTHQVPVTPQMIFMKKEWKRQQISKHYSKQMCEFYRSKEGEILTKVKINPEITLDIGLDEILEEITDESINDPTTEWILLKSFDEGKFIKENEVFNEILPIIEQNFNKRLKIISGNILESEKNEKYPTKYCIFIHDRITFRD